MSNILNDIPAGEPTILGAGDAWSWKRADLAQDYPPAEWTLSYVARLHGDGTKKIEITATASGDEFIVSVSTVDSAAFSSGRYDWAAFVTRTSDSERLRVSAGQWTVKADLAASTTDPRSHSEKVLAAIESVIEGRATKDVETYQIEGRSLTRMKIAELIAFRDRYRSEVFAERRAANGQSGRNRTLISFK